MKSNNIKANRMIVRQAAKDLKAALLKLDKEIDESEMEKVLLEEVLPPFVSKAGICGTSIFSKMEVVKEVQIDSIIVHKAGGVNAGLRSMGMEGLLWFMDHIFKGRTITDKLISYRRGYSEEVPDRREIENLEADFKRLSTLLLEEFYERGQSYEYELKRFSAKELNPA